MRFDEDVFLIVSSVEQDANLNAVQKTVEKFVGKARTYHSKRTNIVKGADGNSIVYAQFECIIYRAVERVQRGDTVRIMRKDGSIQGDFQVADVQTTKAYTTLWL